MLYASLMDKPSMVYEFILTNGIGTVYALLFKDYALTLENPGDIWSIMNSSLCIIRHAHVFEITQLQEKSTMLVSQKQILGPLSPRVISFTLYILRLSVLCMAH